MLPQSTNRYGDLLKEFHDGLKNGNLSEPRLEEIRRVFNELADRENVYRSWMQGDLISFSKIASFTHLLHTEYHRINAVTVADNTETDIVFDDNSVAHLFEQDGAKLRLNAFSRLKTIGFGGYTFWDSNGTGRRAAHINLYNSSDALLYGITMYSVPPVSGDGTVIPYFASVDLSLDQSVEYIKATVLQTSGGPLDMIDMQMNAFLLGTGYE